MPWLLSLVLALGSASPIPGAPGVLEAPACVPAASEAPHGMDDGTQLLATHARSPRYRRVRSTRDLRIPLPRRSTRGPAHPHDLARGMRHAEAAREGLRVREPLARRVALDVLRALLSPRLSSRFIPARSA